MYNPRVTQPIETLIFYLGRYRYMYKHARRKSKPINKGTNIFNDGVETNQKSLPEKAFSGISLISQAITDQIPGF